MKLLDLELQEVCDWFRLGLHLNIPPPKLYTIKHDPTLRSIPELRTEMFSVRTRMLPRPSWSCVVEALMGIGRETLAHSIADKYGTCILLNLKVLYMSLLSNGFVCPSLTYTLFVGVAVPPPASVEKKLPEVDTLTQVWCYCYCLGKGSQFYLEHGLPCPTGNNAFANGAEHPS